MRFAKPSHLEFFRALLVFYGVLGCLVHGIGVIVIAVPLLFPVLGQYGIDPIRFGVLLVMFVGLGQICPPIGINPFVIQSIGDGERGDEVLCTFPCDIVVFTGLFLLMVLPQLALWLPGDRSLPVAGWSRRCCLPPFRSPWSTGKLEYFRTANVRLRLQPDKARLQTNGGNDDNILC